MGWLRFAISSSAALHRGRYTGANIHDCIV
jgi:hypothetical protein